VNVVQVGRLSKFYGRYMGIEDIDFEVPRGEIAAIVGESGAGKTTIVNVLMNFIRPSSGEALISGMDCVTETAKIKRFVGFVPAQIEYYNWMKVKHVLKYAAKMGADNQWGKIGNWLDAFRINENQKVKQLSDNDRKVVSLIQALSIRPQLLICDELFTDMDKHLRHQVFDLLRAENAGGTTMLITAEDSDQVREIASRMIILREGRLVDTQVRQSAAPQQQAPADVEYGSLSGAAAGAGVAGAETLAGATGRPYAPPQQPEAESAQKDSSIAPRQVHRVVVKSANVPLSLFKQLGTYNLQQKGDLTAFLYDGKLDDLLVVLTQIRVEDLSITLDKVSNQRRAAAQPQPQPGYQAEPQRPPQPQAPPRQTFRDYNEATASMRSRNYSPAQKPPYAPEAYAAPGYQAPPPGPQGYPPTYPPPAYSAYRAPQAQPVYRQAPPQYAPPGYAPQPGVSYNAQYNYPAGGAR
jgi:ABC-2 type transport system ATP-binding protein